MSVSPVLFDNSWLDLFGEGSVSQHELWDRERGSSVEACIFYIIMSVEFVVLFSRAMFEYVSGCYCSRSALTVCTQDDRVGQRTFCGFEGYRGLWGCQYVEGLICIRTHIHTYTYVYVCIYIYIYMVGINA